MWTRIDMIRWGLHTGTSGVDAISSMKGLERIDDTILRSQLMYEIGRISAKEEPNAIGIRYFQVESSLTHILVDRRPSLIEGATTIYILKT